MVLGRGLGRGPPRADPPRGPRGDRGGRAGRDPALGPAPAISTEILFNNVRVAFLAFALGITLGVGTAYVLVMNGVLIGTLAGAYGAAGHAGSFWALILPHGVLELIAICIAAGAGLRIGWAIVDPGDRDRSRALADEATRAVIVTLGVIPAFVLAAVIEGFVTGTDVPNAIELAVGFIAGAAYLAFLMGVPGRSGAPAATPWPGVPVTSVRRP